MPHVVYLHSALPGPGARSRPAATRTPLLALQPKDWPHRPGDGRAGSTCPCCVSPPLFHKRGLTGISDLGPPIAHLGHPGGGTAALAFAVALMASALLLQRRYLRGQLVMAGYELADPAHGPPRTYDAPLADHPRLPG